MMEGKANLQVDFKSLTLLWAFAESGIGGILHAFRLPFTGIFVGGIAIMCISLIGYYQGEKKNSILEALAIVLMVKLTVSPQSPWQAYIAVIFQGYVGHWVFKNASKFKVKVFIFSIICLLESGIQKILLSTLIYGKAFLASIDQATLSITLSLGMATNVSLVHTLFVFYLVLHLCSGVVLGLWIPSIPDQLKLLEKTMSDFESTSTKHTLDHKKKSTLRYLGIGIFILMLLFLKLILPEMPLSDIFWILVRYFIISCVLIFVINPLMKLLIQNRWEGFLSEKSTFNTILESIPIISFKAYNWLIHINKTFSGWKKWQYFLLGLILVSRNTNTDHA